MINPTDDLREVLERGARWNALLEATDLGSNPAS